MRIQSAALAALTLLSAANPVSAQIRNQSRRDVRAPDVSVWIDRFTYRPGQRLRTFFQADEGAFVTIVRVSTSGDLSVLYPRRPSLQQAYRIDALIDDEVPYSSELPFFVNEPEGVGFVFAIASNFPFDYRNVSNRDRWNTWQFSTSAYSRYGTRGYPDPYEAVGRFIDQTLPPQADYSTDYIQYQVISDLYRPRRLANYDNIYSSCLHTYFDRAEYYCSQYAGYGYPFYGPIYIARNPQRPPVTPSTPSKNLPRLPGKIHPEPPVVGDGIEKGTKPVQPSPSNTDVERANAQRAWWNTQRKDRDRGNPDIAERSLKTEPQAYPLPEVYRGRRGAPSGATPSYPSQPQYGTPPVRSEPREPREMPVPQQMRPEPVSGGKYETPRAAPEVIRSEPMRVAPAPPPPAPAPQQHSTPVAAPPSAPSSSPSTPSAPVSRPAEKTSKDQ